MFLTIYPSISFFTVIHLNIVTMLATLTLGFKSGLARLKEHSCQALLHSLRPSSSLASCLASDLQYIITLTSLSPKVFSCKMGEYIVRT